MKRILALLLVLMMALSACAFAEEAPVPENDVSGDPAAADAFVIWAWNTDFLTLKGLLEAKYPEMAGRLVFVNCGGSDYYQDKVDALLSDPSNPLYPDIMLLESGYVQKYVQSDVLMPVADLGITQADMANMYEYNLVLGADAANTVKALFWQATPGSYQIRADFAEKYLGTTDPAALQDMLDTWDEVFAVAQKVNEASKGMVKLLPGYQDMQYVFANGARKEGWYDANDVITIDPAMLQYMDLAKQFYEADVTFNAGIWGTDWAALKDGDGETTPAAMMFMGCPWYSYWCLTDTWVGNTILIKGPQDFYWGGTGLAATVGCADKELAKTILYNCTCDQDFMVEIYKANNDFLNNKAAIQYIIDNGVAGTSSFRLFGDQNACEFYVGAGGTIDATLARGEDMKISENLFPTQVTAYATGEKDKDAAIADFKAAVHDTYPYLMIG